MNRLKQIRERKSLTLAQVSARTSIPLRLLGDYEGNVQEISPAHLKVLSKALWVKPEELLVPEGQPAPPPAPAYAPAPPALAGAGPAPPAPAGPPAPPAVSAAPPADALAAAVAAGPAPAPVPAYAAPRPYTPAPPYGAPRPPRPAVPPLAGGGPGRAPLRPRRDPVVMPATDGQITEIMRLAARLNLSTDEIEQQFGRAIDNITRFDAREWIKKLREDALAKAPPSKVHFGQWPGLKEDREAAYLGELRDEAAVLRVTLFNGQAFTGRIVDYTPYTITLDEANPEHGDHVVLRKLAIAYYQRTGGTGDSAMEPVGTVTAKEIAPFNGSSAPHFSPPAAEAPAAAPAAAGPGDAGDAP